MGITPSAGGDTGGDGDALDDGTGVADAEGSVTAMMSASSRGMTR
jgi:hypothetical protein